MEEQGCMLRAAKLGVEYQYNKQWTMMKNIIRIHYPKGADIIRLLPTGQGWYKNQG